jgi:hypothetical protein
MHPVELATSSSLLSPPRSEVRREVARGRSIVQGAIGRGSVFVPTRRPFTEASGGGLGIPPGGEAVGRGAWPASANDVAAGTDGSSRPAHGRAKAGQNLPAPPRRQRREGARRLSRGQDLNLRPPGYALGGPSPRGFMRIQRVGWGFGLTTRGERDMPAPAARAQGVRCSFG